MQEYVYYKRKNMNKQLMIIGFHRSGTSMLAQELTNAGLFIGDKLLGGDISNVDGHFEDYDFFSFHEKILKDSNNSWQYTSIQEIPIHKKYDIQMQKMIDHRNNLSSIEIKSLKAPEKHHF